MKLSLIPLAAWLKPRFIRARANVTDPLDKLGEVTRRHFLEMATVGAGLATIGSSLNPAITLIDPTQQPCLNVVSLFWSITGARISGFRCEPCCRR